MLSRECHAYRYRFSFRLLQKNHRQNRERQNGGNEPCLEAGFKNRIFHSRAFRKKGLRFTPHTAPIQKNGTLPICWCTYLLHRTVKSNMCATLIVLKMSAIRYPFSYTYHSGSFRTLQFVKSFFRLCCIRSSAITRAVVGQLFTHAQHLIHAVASVSTPLSTVMAADGHTSAHVPHVVQSASRVMGAMGGIWGRSL
jgi:hypothetical protein